MQVKAFIAPLLLAVTVAAAPTGQGINKELDFLTSENTFKDITNALGNKNANGSGNGSGSHNGNGNGNGNAIGSGNQATGDILNDSLNFGNGANSRQISEAVVAAIKSLAMTCTPNDDGTLSCTWRS